MAAQKLRCMATIVMPRCTPQIKIANVERLGARVVLHGDDFDDAKVKCAQLVAEHGWINIPPYDNPYVIAGQGTCAMEIMRQAQRLSMENLSSSSLDTGVDVIFCAVGGGGLSAGMTAYIKRVYPDVRIVGVETFDANSMYQSLEAGHPVTLKQVGLFAEGAAVRVVGKENFRICYGNRKWNPVDHGGLDEVILVTNDEICAAIKDVFVETRTVLEPAGALGLAGLKRWAVSHTDDSTKPLRLVAVTSGANMNFDRLRFVAERASLGEQVEALMSVVIPETQGSFMKLYQIIHPRFITEFSYRYGDHENAHIFVSFQVQNRDEELDEILGTLSKNGMTGCDLSHDELAKSHARFMIGGRNCVSNERLFQFTFPERPGALQRFLEALKSDWNVSLFHYRQIGGDVGKVLVGMQVDPERQLAFDKFLVDLSYPYREETESHVYRQFLS